MCLKKQMQNKCKKNAIEKTNAKQMQKNTIMQIKCKKNMILQKICKINANKMQKNAMKKQMQNKCKKNAMEKTNAKQMQNKYVWKNNARTYANKMRWNAMKHRDKHRQTQLQWFCRQFIFRIPQNNQTLFLQTKMKRGLALAKLWLDQMAGWGTLEPEKKYVFIGSQGWTSYFEMALHFLWWPLKKWKKLPRNTH